MSAVSKQTSQGTMSAVNLEKYNLSLLTAKEDILNIKSSTNWAVFAYEKNYDLKLSDSGAGGLAELTDKFMENRVLYALLRVKDPSKEQPRIILINWIGEKVDAFLKETCAGHLPAIKTFFKEAHAFLTVHRVDELTSEAIQVILSRISTSGRISRGTRTLGSETLVGTNYRKTNPALEMRRTNRDSFWAQAEREEDQRKEEERQRRQEEKKRWERERIEQEKREAEERERKIKEKENMIDEQRKAQARLEAEERKKEKAKWEQQQREHEAEMRDKFRRSESIEKAAEAAVLVSQRSLNPRDFFRQREQRSISFSPSYSPTSPTGSGGPRRPFLRYQRSLTESAFIFRTPESPVSPSNSLRNEFFSSMGSRTPEPVSSSSGFFSPTSPTRYGSLPPTVPPRTESLPSACKSPPPTMPRKAGSLPPVSPPRAESQPPVNKPQIGTPPPTSPLSVGSLHHINSPRDEFLSSVSPSRDESSPTSSPSRSVCTPPANTPRPESLPFINSKEESTPTSNPSGDPPQNAEPAHTSSPSADKSLPLESLSSQDSVEPQHLPWVEPVLAESPSTVESLPPSNNNTVIPASPTILQTSAKLVPDATVQMPCSEDAYSSESVADSCYLKSQPELDSLSAVQGVPLETQLDSSEFVQQEEPFETPRSSCGRGPALEEALSYVDFTEKSCGSQEIHMNNLKHNGIGGENWETAEDQAAIEDEAGKLETGSLPKLCVRVLQDYNAEDDSKLSLERGDIITVLEKCDNAWWCGRKQDGQCGFFPMNYVESV
ncbi:drebrin-like protein A [Microcaecilia unicolor]|uniref:Drebrin-like protein A n=1 Tax=Microcaecilia unicolor TaxID=1415580 RepID=A0A6P7X9J1_9AMPH|nr:drebrin-like protein A [Microcaecilia unicolor]